MVRQTNPKDDYIVLKTLVFPYINVLWAGVIIMVMGFFISLGRVFTSKSRKKGTDTRLNKGDLSYAEG
jgi:cytochrome c-type biogenesis protein CcmF